MNKYFKAIASVMVTLALVLSAFSSPVSVLATFDYGSTGFSGMSFQSLPELVIPSGATESNSGSVYSESSSRTRCAMTSNLSDVVTGGSITLNWDTSGFDTLTINGETVSGDKGSKTYSNIQKDTSYVLKGSNSSGGSCRVEVRVNCFPPAVTKVCELDVQKTVNKTTSSIGDELTYTITVKNVGDANCTGGGVKIIDVVDKNLVYKDYSISGDISAGYGSSPVYTNTDRTLHFNGNTLTPGESGTITWTGVVSEPTTCGDFEVKNQAQATAKELNNFQTWVYSPTVKTAIDNDCEVTKCDDTEMWKVKAVLTEYETDYFTVKFTNPTDCEVEVGATSYKVPVDDAGELCGWENHNLDCQIRYDYEDIVLSANSVKEVTVGKPTKCYQFDWYYGKSVETIDYSGDPLHSYVGRLIDAVLVATVEDCREVEVSAPTCDLFTATPGTIAVGGSSTLNWKTSNAKEVYINNGVGAVDINGSISVSPLSDITYLLTVVGVDDKKVTCEVPIKVSEDSVPVCESFTATPNNLPVGGGNVVLDWTVLGATDVSISPTVGAVGLSGMRTLSIASSTNFVLSATDNDGDIVTCSAPVTVADPVTNPFTCANNVSFSASDTSIRRGENATLNWNTTKVDTVSISVINATTLSGSKVVTPSADTTYVLSATQGDNTISCPLSINVTTGGGGGGSSSPRCDLEISDSKIKLGEQVTVKWDTSNATEVTLTDDRGKVLFTTDDYLSSDKAKYLDDSIKLKPTRDTKYTLLATRGSREEECDVSVDVTDDIVVLQTRDQQPLVAGISLSQVPYTGFDAGPFMTIMFYVLLVAWALYITYLMVIRKRMNPAGNNGLSENSEINFSDQIVFKPAETSVVNSLRTSVATNPVPMATTPVNLPIAKPVIGYENIVEEPEITNPHQVNDVVVTALENRAHSQKALLSSDAVRYFIGNTSTETERNEALDSVVAEAKKTYPLEDGWVVINESRMQNLCLTCKINRAKEATAPFVPATVPEGTGSLAEAIVTGNVIAAYEMIGHRPMFALADAAADLDAVYRKRRGGEAQASNMLWSETKDLSDEKIKAMITALTSAIDGTYSDEASAVKMAIMKAVKEAA